MRLIFILILMSFSSFAQDCKDVSISTQHMPKNNNQNQHNWCVFWATADLYSFYEQESLSSYDLGFQYFNNDQYRDNSVIDFTDVGGNITAAMILAQGSKGICLESQTNYTNSDWFELSVMFKKLSDPKKNLINIICENNYQHSSPIAEIPKDIIKILDKLSADKKAAALLDVACGKRHQLKNKYGVGNRSIEKFPPEKIIERLDQVLNQKTPATVSYDWDFIKNGPDYIKKEDNHTSTIIGRRTNPTSGVCEYQIKDSAGNRCPKNTIYECNKDNGTIWVPRENLQKNIYEVNWLVKAKN